VISVGNLTVGGSGKTPVVAHIAELLLREGERPAILTRGYGRPNARAGVTVVSDPSRVVARFADAGDEPLMLARSLPGVPVLVGADRVLSGRYAEAQFKATVHILDDGFQHVALERDVDLLLADEEVLRDRVLPAGRLREPIAAAACADAVLVTREILEPDAAAPARDARTEAPDATTVEIAQALNVATAFTVVRMLGDPVGASKAQPVFAIAGIARPERFFADLRAAGWRVAGTLAFRDHHRFSRADLDRIRAGARSAGASLVLTTSKDAVRLEELEVDGLRSVAVPLVARVEPAGRFREWLMAKLRRPR
jgi:tetraacyldisaccharide 4'-kinase